MKAVRRLVPVVAAAVTAVAVAGATVLYERSPSPRSGDASARFGFPPEPARHALAVAPGTGGATLFVGTDDGVYRSRDRGRSWAPVGFVGADARNVAVASGGIVWVAGRNLLARSVDGGSSWRRVVPLGLPNLRIHCLAVDAADPRRVWLLLWDGGLYRSVDRGRSFRFVSSALGQSVTGIAVSGDGEVFAADADRGVLESSNGARWRRLYRGAGADSIAVAPSEPAVVLVGGRRMIGTLDEGRHWQEVYRRPASPVAFVPDQAGVAYAIGSGGRLYRSVTAGTWWEAVGRPALGKRHAIKLGRPLSGHVGPGGSPDRTGL